MLAAALTTTPPSTERHLSLTQWPIPSPAPHEALLRVILAGICGTDLELLAGYKPLPHPQILGHEFVATIHAYHPTLTHPPFPLHTRVVAEINCVTPDSTSRSAFERAQDACRDAVGIFGRDGAFAQFLCVPLVNLHKVPEGVSDEDAVFIEPIAAACRIFEQIRMPRSHVVAVLGVGKMGWLVGHVLAACGMEVDMLTRGRNLMRDQRLAKEFGVGVRVPQADEEDVYEVVVDCTGDSAGLQTAVRMVKPRGVVVLKSTVANGGTLDLTPVVVKEVTVVGSRCGPFDVAIRLVERKAVRPRALVEQVFKLDDIENAVARAKTKGILKVLVRPTCEG